MNKKMKKTIKLLFAFFCILLLTGCTSINNKETRFDSMKIIINGKEYIVKLESNNTVSSLLKMLPLKLEMKELNGNEKYVYFNESLPTNPSNPKKINKGDLMLFGNNCLVLFYESFDTTYSYTKIGHINNLPKFNKEKIKVTLKK